MNRLNRTLLAAASLHAVRGFRALGKAPRPAHSYRNARRNLARALPLSGARLPWPEAWRTAQQLTAASLRTAPQNLEVEKVVRTLEVTDGKVTDIGMTRKSEVEGAPEPERHDCIIHQTFGEGECPGCLVGADAESLPSIEAPPGPSMEGLEMVAAEKKRRKAESAKPKKTADASPKKPVKKPVKKTAAPTTAKKATKPKAEPASPPPPKPPADAPAAAPEKPKRVRKPAAPKPEAAPTPAPTEAPAPKRVILT